MRTFFIDLVPDLPSDPYTEAGARTAEAAALRLFPDVDAADPAIAQESVLQIDAFHRYIGELLIRNFDARWIYDDAESDEGPEPMIELPYSTTELAPRTVLTSLAHRRTGDELAFIVREQVQHHQLWVDAGRPPLPEWRKLRVPLRRAQLRNA